MLHDSVLQLHRLRHIICDSSPGKNTHVPLDLIPCPNVALGTLLTAADLGDKFHPAAENTNAQLNPSIPCPGRPSNCSEPQRKSHPIKAEKGHISGNFHQVGNFF